MRLSGNIDKRTIQGQFLTISKFPDGIGVECYIQNVTLASSEKKRKIYLDQKEEKETKFPREFLAQGNKKVLREVAPRETCPWNHVPKEVLAPREYSLNCLIDKIQ